MLAFGAHSLNSLLACPHARLPAHSLLTSPLGYRRLAIISQTRNTVSNPRRQRTRVERELLHFGAKYLEEFSKAPPAVQQKVFVGCTPVKACTSFCARGKE